MSRIGKKPISVPKDVQVLLEKPNITIKGKLGQLSYSFLPEVDVNLEGDQLIVVPIKKTKSTAAFWGLTRALLANMIKGVSEGFEKKLEIEGVGYRASVSGNKLTLSVGFSHPVELEAPEGIKISVEKNTITVSGFDKTLVGQMAANIRAIKKPEPYKGKGIHYLGEKIRRKAGKKAATASA
ncbi:MAG: 50S ribosomal protein L6 [Parcubacteria group bacterium GW2011_GWA2_39_18]|nr:MAG: 50S ribosomal protein L6 [Parcubacteria group bacterium GW2011_GWA2_39_18]